MPARLPPLSRRRVVTVVAIVAAVILASSTAASAASAVATPQNDSTGVGESNETDESDETDGDGDGLSDRDERVHGTDPTDPDTDSDGVSDGEEVERGTNPMSRDTDADGVSDLNDEAPTNPEVPNESSRSNATTELTSEDSDTLAAIAGASREYAYAGGGFVAGLVVGFALFRRR